MKRWKIELPIWRRLRLMMEKSMKKAKKKAKKRTTKKAVAKQVGGDHYTKMGIQVWDYIIANNLPYMEGNIIRYVSRWRNKGGVEDLLKAKHYIDKLLENERKRR